MQVIVKSIALYVAYFAEIAAALVIVFGSLQAIWIYLTRATFSKSKLTQVNLSRIKLGYSLSLGLSFLVGADIIKTAIAPTWTEIGQLSAVVVIRILLNYFLLRDLKEYEQIDKEKYK